MKKFSHNKGFTLIETLIAILILSMTIGALMTLAAGGFYGVRYARNDIVATSLVQESLEYIRNTRDTAIQQGISWEEWKAAYGDANDGTVCFDSKGCIINTYAEDPNSVVEACSANCPYMMYFSNAGLYGYIPSIIEGYNDDSDTGANAVPQYETTFIRKVIMEDADDGNQVVVKGTMTWRNGTLDKTTTQSIILTRYY